MTRSSRPPKADNVLQFRPAQSETPQECDCKYKVEPGEVLKFFQQKDKQTDRELTSPVYSEKFVRILHLFCDKRVEGLLRETHLDELTSFLLNLRPGE